MKTNEIKNTKDTLQSHTDESDQITHWELAALMGVSKNYWDLEVLTSESWDEARDAMAIDSLLGSLASKVARMLGTDGNTSGQWPLENEQELKKMWEDSQI